MEEVCTARLRGATIVRYFGDPGYSRHAALDRCEGELNEVEGLWADDSMDDSDDSRWDDNLVSNRGSSKSFV